MVLYMSRPWKHPKTGVYYFRKVVPEAMRQLVGKVEERRTLGTKDPREAARKFTEVAAKVAAEWEALRRGPVMADLARNFVQQLGPDGRAALADDLIEVDLKAAGVMDEQELPDEWEPLRTPQRQKAISRVIERRGLASWIERAEPRPDGGTPGVLGGDAHQRGSIRFEHYPGHPFTGHRYRCLNDPHGHPRRMVDGGEGYGAEALDL
jgi:hypothetical protein